MRYAQVKTEFETPEEQEEQRQFHAIKVACYLNIIQCHQRQQKLHLVISTANKLLEMDPLTPTDRTKAHYRRALAYLGEKRLEEAFEDLECAMVACEGKDGAVVREYEMVKEKILEAKERERLAYAKMFQ